MYANSVVNEPKRLQTSNFLLWVVLVVPLFFLPNSKDVFNFPKVAVFCAMTFGALVHYLLGPKQKHLSLDHRIILGSLLGATLFVSLSAVFSETSQVRAIFGYPNRSNGLLTYLFLFLFIWVVSNMELDEEYAKKLERTLLILFMAFAAYGLIQLLDLDPINWNNPYNRIIGTLGNPNFSGAFFGIFGAILVHFFIHKRERNRYIYLALSLFSVFLGLATQSFQAVMIFAIGISIQILTYAKKRFGNTAFVFFLGVMSFAGIFAFLSFIGIGPLGEKLRQATLILRLEYWRVGLETAQKFPVFGIGPDNYTEGWRLFRSSDFVKSYSEAVSVDSAHNVLINFMANFGVPAFICMMILNILIATRAIKLLFSNPEEGTVKQSIALLWLLLFVQSLFSLEQVGLNVLQWSVGALMLNPKFFQSSTSLKGRKKENLISASPQRSFSARGELAVVSMIFCFISFLPFLNQEIKLNRLGTTQVDKSVSQEYINQSLEGFGKYAKSDMGRTIVISDFLLRAERYSDAQALVESVLEGEPRDFQALEQLARLARFRSELDIEIEYRKRIEQIDPQNYNNFISLAEAYKGSGDSFNAKMYAQRALSLSNDEKVNQLAKSILGQND